MKKHLLLAIILLVLLAAMAPVLTSCSAITNTVNATVFSTGTEEYTDAARTADEAIAAITASPDIDMPTGLVDPGYLTIASDGAYPPLEFLAKVVTKEGDDTSDTTELVGFEVDLYTAVAKKLGLEPVYVQVAFDKLPSVLTEGEEVDLAASGVITNQESLTGFLASDPYLSADLAICTPSGVEAPDEASLQGKIVGVQTGSTVEPVVEAIAGIAEVRLFPHVASAFADLREGEIDAVVEVEPVAEWIISTGEDYATSLTISGTIETGEAYAFWCNKTDQALMDAVNAALAELMQAPEPQVEATTTTELLAADSTTTTVEEGTTTTVEGATTTTAAPAETAKSVYQLLLEKWGLADE